jgi:hypothetical protein
VFANAGVIAVETVVSDCAGDDLNIRLIQSGCASDQASDVKI